MISFERLLEIFWGGIDPTKQSRDRQYASIVFYHNDYQRREFEEYSQRLGALLGTKIAAETVQFKRFYPAEDYHQKYYLQRSRELMKALKEVYPNPADLLRSTAASRLNAYRAGFMTADRLRAELVKIGEIKPHIDRIMEAVRGAGVLTAH